MDKNIEIGLLMDFYGELLTDRQKDIMDLYYNDNLSLSEIAEELEISKQGVQDNIKRAEKSLYEVEEKLGLLERFEEHSEKIHSAIKILEEVKQACENDKLDEIENILKELLNDQRNTTPVRVIITHSKNPINDGLITKNFNKSIDKLLEIE